TFYQRSEKVIRYQYNTDTVSATVSTLELRTAIKVFGKKYTAEEKKNYNPIRTTDIKYSNGFIKIVHGEHAYFEGELNRFNKHIRY
ncbi:hypothetical protein ACMGEH_15880, partial [Staphylococcus aureus]